MQEDIDRAYNTYKRSSSIGEHSVGEQRTLQEGEYAPSVQPRSETKVECRNVEK
jgi:hypothetical protein